MEQVFDGQDAGAFYAANRIEELAATIEEKDDRIADLESKYYNSFTIEMVEGIVAEKDARINELEQELTTSKDAQDMWARHAHNLESSVIPTMQKDYDARIAELEADNFKLRCIASEAVSESVQLDATRKTRIAELEAQLDKELHRQQRIEQLAAKLTI